MSVRTAWDRIPRRPRATLVVAGALTLATLAIAALEAMSSISYAAPVYLLAVIVAGVAAGTIPAIVTTVAAFLLYDSLFVQPLYTLTISDPAEWLNLLLLLAVAVVVGQLVSLQAQRAREADQRAREAQALFRISRALATSRSLDDAAGRVLAEIAASAAMDRAWLGLGPAPGEERVVADTRPRDPLPTAPIHVVLERTPGDEPARWVRTHVASGPRRPGRTPVVTVLRVRVEVPGEALGSLWALRSGDAHEPSGAETRIVAAAADQLAQAVRHDRMVADALRAEVARQSEALRTALLDSVSHDLRTPLATIRATAGSLLDHEVDWSPAERDDALRSIDGEAERMNRLVRDLLDLSRIEGGALHPELEPHDVDECIDRVVRRTQTAKRIEVDLPADLPPIIVDDTYVDEVLTNLVENAIRYGGDTVRLAAVEEPSEAAVVVVVEDDGAGVPEADLGRLFDKFFRVARGGEGSRKGMGIGLTVAQGLTRAMGGSIHAARSPMGGLAVMVRLRAAERPAADDGPAAAPPAAG